MKKILLIKHGSLGDIISATAVMKDIKDHFKNDKIFILTARNYRHFFLESSLVDEIIIDNREGILKSFFILKKILKLKFNLIIDLQNSKRTSIYEFFFRILKKTEINGTGIFATIRYKNPKYKLPHAIEGLSRQVEKIGIKAKRKPFLDWLVKDDFNWKKIKNDKFVIINPGCSKKNIQKKWSEKNYTKVCEFLISKNILPILIGANDDKEAINYITNKVKSVLNLYNESPLDVIYTIAKRAICCISNDTGPAHLIAASGCKIHLILSTFSNIKTVIPQNSNVTYTQKKDINSISPNEIIMEIQKKFDL